MPGMAAVMLVLSAPAASTQESTCVLSTNFENSQYTVPIKVGTPGQVLHAVPDSGSFELIMTSKECVGCDGHAVFDSSNSSSFISLGTELETKFGQGDVTSTINYDRVQLGDLAAPKQSILLMKDNQLRNFLDAAYDAVMGMGREKLARSYSSDLSLLASLGASVTGICVGQHDQEPGRLQIGTEIPTLDYVSLPVYGDTHWAIKVTEVSLPSAKSSGDAIVIPGCEGTMGCSAIVDSGTSLIALPKTILDTVLDKIGTINSDCSNVDELPSLRFSAGGHDFDIPPQLYVAKMLDDDDYARSSLFDFFKLPFLKQATRLDAQRESCVPLFMEMDIATSFNGLAMILGLPFLRKYAGRFDRDSKTISLGSIPLGSSLCTHCGETHAYAAQSSSALLAGSVSLAAAAGAMQPEAAPVQRQRPRLAPRSLRMPSWAHLVHKDEDGQHRLAI